MMARMLHHVEARQSIYMLHGRQSHGLPAPEIIIPPQKINFPFNQHLRPPRTPNFPSVVPVLQAAGVDAKLSKRVRIEILCSFDDSSSVSRRSLIHCQSASSARVCETGFIIELPCHIRGSSATTPSFLGVVWSLQSNPPRYYSAPVVRT